MATLYGAAFHLISGGDAKRLALYLLAGWLGFSLGHLLGNMLEIRVLMIGPLYAFTATLGAVVALVAARLLNRRLD